MMTPESFRPMIQTLLNSQIQAVLTTQHQLQPYTILLAFAMTQDLRHIVFVTARATQKYANLMANPRASLLIDNRCNDSTDYRKAVAISAQGVTREVDAVQRAEQFPLYLSKPPHLRDCVTDAACALLQLDLECYDVVSQFQNVSVSERC